MSNEQKTEVGGQRSEVQVYMRWVGTRNGERFMSAGIGPWGVGLDGNVVLLDAADDSQLEHERNDLEKFSHVSDLRLEVAEIRDGVLGEYKPMINAIRTAPRYKVMIEHGHAQVHEGTAAALKKLPAVKSGIMATVINGKPVVDTLSQRPCNVILRKAMNACANAFLPDRSELQERAEDADSIETMRELFYEFIADMTEYGAMAGAYQLRKAAHAKEDDQVSAVIAAYKLIGAPGDFGYEEPRGKTWCAVLQTYDAVLKERMGVLDAEAASGEVTHG